MTPHADLLPRYKHLRQVALRLNNRLVESLPKSVLDEGGKKLGLLKKNVITLDTEDEIAVLMDYCIYDVRREGANAAERFLAKSPPAPDSDERVLLEAMRQARYSLFVVEGAERGVGVHVRDLLRDEVVFLMDVGFSSTAQLGMVLASRIMAPDGITMTTGAALPVGVLPPADRDRFLERLVKGFKQADFRNLSPEEASEIATLVIRSCLQQGAAERIQYAEPGSGPMVRTPAPPRPARRPGRNDRCPCGSGRKFKNCCGSRRGK
jgi:SEC-C motif-containing protein